MKNFFSRVFSTVVGIFIFCAIITLMFVFLIAISSIGEMFSSKKIDDNSVLELRLAGDINESTTEIKSNFLGIKEENPIYFKDILDMIEAAKSDDKIKGISLKLSDFQGGSTQMTEIHNALKDFKKSGKFIYAYGCNLDQKSYYVASVADSVFLNPTGMIDFKGLALEVQFYKNLGDKYGIEFQVIRHGAFKGAVEPFIRTDLSPENRKQYQELVDGIWKNTIQDISASRKIDTIALNTIADSVYSIIPDDALKHKLVDKMMQETEYDNFLKKKLNVKDEDELSIVHLSDYIDEYKKKYDGDNQVAVINAAGEITSGEGNEGIKGEEFKKLIRELRDNEDVKAVVLRINSPGGDATASDEILYELKLLKAKKPLMVSFGDVAASGGYYIAMAADQIYCENNTITGSIGVFGMAPNFKKLANNVGITSDYVSTNKNSLFYSPMYGFSDDAKNKITQSIEHTYQRFVSHVMNNRKLTFQQVDSIGGGRVWIGEKAKQLKLVDAIGSLDDAIKAAAKKANISDDFYVNNYPKATDGFQEFMDNLTGKNTKVELLKSELGEENYQLYQQVKQLKEKNSVMMLLPYRFDIK